MPDYQLDRLCTRSFEQLVQALGTKILGPQLMVFGDGPDGGREAVFRGAVPFPKGKKRWNGVGVVQAKFRQVPDSDPKKNADWAIGQLRSEFEKLAPRRRKAPSRAIEGRICPHYYVFATNLRLSSVATTGGKDRIRVVLEGYKESHGLVDFAIWDGDQVARFLDTYPEIRTTFAAWVLPGDVLAAMLSQLDLGATDFSKTIRRYLEVELLDDQFAKLSQGGYTDAKSVPLSAVFVDLPVAKGPDLSVSPKSIRPSSRTHGNDGKDGEGASTFLELLFEESGRVLKPSAIGTRGNRVKEGRELSGRLVLVGGPGQGKTTVGQFACQLLRASLLRTTGSAPSREIAQALDRIEEQSDGIPPVRARRYPLRVDLKYLAAALASKDSDRVSTLFDFFIRRIAERTSSTISQHHFRKWLGAYPWILVLDGLDEVPASSNRQQVMQAIRDFISVEAHGADADMLVLATTRPQGYSEEFDPTLYRHIALAPLNADQALAYGRRLAMARHPGQLSRSSDLTNALKSATRNPATARLMQSPLQVTIMLALIEGGGQPPEQRWKLFHDYYDVIYRREKERGTAFSAILSRYEPDLHWIHHRAGWLLQQRNAMPGQTDARLTHEEFARIVDERLQKSGHDNVASRAELVEAIRRAATDRLVFLVGNTEKEIGFEIRSLQEFMAAEHFFDGREACVQAALHCIAPFPYWRNVFLFAAGRVYFDRQSLIDSVVAVCQQMNDDPVDVAQRSILAGSRIALALLRDGATRNQPASARVVSRCGARVLDLHDDEGTAGLSDLLTGEAKDVWDEELSTRLEMQGRRAPFHNWILCAQLMGIGRPWAKNVMVRTFPWGQRYAFDLISHAWQRQSPLPDAFWVEVARNPYSYPLRIFNELALFGRSPKPLEELPMSRFALRISESFVQYPLLLEDGSSSGIHARIVGAKSLEAWADLRVPTKARRGALVEWQVAAAVAEFAANPTKANLAKQLGEISRVVPGDSEKGAEWYLPWQIALAMSSRREGYSWDDIISNVSAGGLGSESEWMQWEQHGRKGLKLSQIRSGPGLKVSMEYQGAIVRVGGGYFWDAEGKSLSFVDECSSALQSNQSIMGNRGLLDLCGVMLLNHSRDDPDAIRGVLDRFVTACETTQSAISAQTIQAIAVSTLPDGERLKMLARVGSGPIRQGWRVPDWVGRAIVDEPILRLFRKLPRAAGRRRDVLVAMSYLPPRYFHQEIDGMFLDDLRGIGGRYASAAAVLKAKSFRWKVDDAARIADESLSVHVDYPNHLDELLEYIESSGQFGGHLEHFLMALLRQDAEKLSMSQLSRVTELLVKLIERRPATSVLPDPAEVA